ncbi:MAG: cytochrome c [Gammaproteobacteria bacterium]|nr:cytochrome c [Gammaproteobacteria bacterium]
MKKYSWKFPLIVTLAVPLVFGGLFAYQDATAEDTAGSTPADPMQFVRGAKTWANTCARCHNMRDPRELRDDQWQGVVAHMRVRANLTGKEARDVLLFLQQSN